MRKWRPSPLNGSGRNRWGLEVGRRCIRRGWHNLRGSPLWQLTLPGPHHRSVTNRDLMFFFGLSSLCPCAQNVEPSGLCGAGDWRNGEKGLIGTCRTGILGPRLRTPASRAHSFLFLFLCATQLYILLLVLTLAYQIAACAMPGPGQVGASQNHLLARRIQPCC